MWIGEITVEVEGRYPPTRYTQIFRWLEQEIYIWKSKNRARIRICGEGEDINKRWAISRQEIIKYRF